MTMPKAGGILLGISAIVTLIVERLPNIEAQIGAFLAYGLETESDR